MNTSHPFDSSNNSWRCSCEPPAPVKNFTMPKPPAKFVLDSEMDNVMVTHKLMAGLLAKALQCNQTKVFNVLLSDTTSNLRRAGSTDHSPHADARRADRIRSSAIRNRTPGSRPEA